MIFANPLAFIEVSSRSTLDAFFEVTNISAAFMTGRKMFSPGYLADRPRPTRQQIVGPSMRTGGRVEQR
jgi:hypothetical protein